MEYQQAKDSTMITIKDDPRLGNRNTVKLAQNQQRERLRKSSDQLTIRMDKLTEAEEVCKKVETHYKDVTGATADSIRKQTKVMQDSIKAIREFISGKTQTRQGYGQVPQVTVMNQLQQANQSIGSKPIVPGPQEEMLVVRAEQLIAEAVGRVDRFMAGPWASYRVKVEGTKQSFFKE
jgi:type IV secretory pathway VirB4 component